MPKGLDQASINSDAWMRPRASIPALQMVPSIRAVIASSPKMTRKRHGRLLRGERLRQAADFAHIRQEGVQLSSS